MQLLPPRADCAAYILAGGASRRMGRDKAGLEIKGRSLVEHIAARVQACVGNVYVVVKEAGAVAAPGLPRVYERAPERALVHGIRTVLLAPGPAWRFILACDMPEVDADALGALWRCAQTQGAPGACARTARGIEPLPSLWHTSLGSAIGPDWGMSAQRWVEAAGLGLLASDPDPAWLLNLNTPSEWGEYCSTRP